jgi:phosphatidylglycerol:prolipoprotein diacylglycerol transferase
MSVAVILLLALPLRRQAGDVVGLALLTGGVAIFITEFWRDWEGRGVVLNGALDGPQIAAIVMVILGALLLRERKRSRLPELSSEIELSEADHD